MDTVGKLIRQIYSICMEDLSANCREIDHLEYIKYRVCGGRKSEESWFMEQANPIDTH